MPLDDQTLKKHILWRKNTPFLYQQLCMRPNKYRSNICQWLPIATVQSLKAQLDVDSIDYSNIDELSYITQNENIDIPFVIARRKTDALSKTRENFNVAKDINEGKKNPRECCAKENHQNGCNCTPKKVHEHLPGYVVDLVNFNTPNIYTPCDENVLDKYHTPSFTTMQHAALEFQNKIIRAEPLRSDSDNCLISYKVGNGKVIIADYYHTVEDKIDAYNANACGDGSPSASTKTGNGTRPIIRAVLASEGRGGYGYDVDTAGVVNCCDNGISYWDINVCEVAGILYSNVGFIDINSNDIRPLFTINNAHDHAVNECKIVKMHGVAKEGNADILASVGHDGHLKLWDKRSDIKRCVLNTKVGNEPVLCLDFNNLYPYVCATGGYNNYIYLWDVRYVRDDGKSVPLKQLKHKSQCVKKLQFHPCETSLILSLCQGISNDGEHITNNKAGKSNKDINKSKYHMDKGPRGENSDLRILPEVVSKNNNIYLWDLSNSAKESIFSKLDKQDGCTELIFNHAGHTHAILDANFNSDYPSYVISTDCANMLHIWSFIDSFDEETYTKLQYYHEAKNSSKP